MAYTTATITESTPQGDGRIQIVVQFNGPGVNTLQQTLNGNATTSQADLGVQTGRHMARLNANLSAAAQLSAGTVLDTAIPAPPPPPIPTAAEVARALWLGKYRLLRRVKQDGVLRATDAGIAELEADVRATYLVSYLPFVENE